MGKLYSVRVRRHDKLVKIFLKSIKFYGSKEITGYLSFRKEDTLGKFPCCISTILFIGNY